MTTSDEWERILISIARHKDENNIEVSALPSSSLAPSTGDLNRILPPDDHARLPPNISLLSSAHYLNDILPPEAQTSTVNNLASDFALKSESPTFEQILESIK